MTSLPIFLKTKDLSNLPQLHYLVAENGNFLVKQTPLYSSITPVTNLVGLDRQESELKIHLPPIPRKLMEQIYSFFLTVYRRWGGEAIVFLYFHPAKNVYEIGVPPQTLFRSIFHGGWQTQHRIAYGYIQRPFGYLKVGDAHSHANLPAFFSCADDLDDAGQEGLHLVMGKLNCVRPDLSASFVVGRHRFTLPASRVTEDFSHPTHPPETWLQQITVRNDDWKAFSWNENRNQNVQDRDGE